MNKYFLILLYISLVACQFDWEQNGLPIRQGVHIEWQRTGDNGNDDEMIYAWSDTRSGGRDVYIQKVNSNGELLWGSEGSPVVIADGRQEDPILVTDGNGGAFVIWVDYRDEPDNGDIYGQHIANDGSASWGLSGVPLTNLEGKQVSPNMCSDGIGGAFVIWNDLSVSTLGHTYGTHLTIEQSDIISPGVGVPLISNNSQHSGVSIEKAALGSAIMVWADDRNVDNSGIDIYTQRIDTNCNTLWSLPEEGGIPLCDSSGNQEYSKVTYYDENVSVVVWEDRRYNPLYGDIFIQYIDMDGNLQLSTEGEAICSNEAPQIKPRVKAGPQGAFVVWEDVRNISTTGSDIYMQHHILGQGPQLEEDGFGICTATGSQDQPRLTVDGNGGAYVVWMDERYADFPETEIFMQHIDINGTTSFQVDGLAVCEESGYQFNPLVRNDGNGNVFALWGDMRSGSIGLYTQIISPSTGSILDNGGVELYFGIDGNGASAKTLYLDNDETLIYWEDHRLGVIADLTYGQKVYDGWENIVEPNGYKLSNNEYQISPLAEKIEDNIFLGFGEAFGDIVLHYQLLDLNNLQILGDDNGTPVFDSGTPQNNYDISETNDGEIFFVFSDQRNFIDNDIYVQRYDLNGVGYYNEPKLVVDNFFVDDNIKYIAPYIDGGCLITYDSGDFTGTRAFVTAVDDLGDVIENWSGGIRLSSEESDQFIKGLATLSNKYFIIWKDQRSGSADIYGQMIDLEGNLLGPEGGIPIATQINDQQAPTISYNQISNEIIVCWEDFRNGSDFDVYCSIVDSNTLEVSDAVDLCVYSGNQKTPSVYATLTGSYLFAWEDSRAGVTSDIYFQSMTNNIFDYTDNGVVLCDADFNQFNPKIDLYNESNGSYMIYWDDMRSSGKEDLKNIYVQSFTASISECNIMDVNNDSIINVIDIVQVVNIVLGSIEPDAYQSCAADINGDGIINVIDIVNIVNFILS